jgi:subtilisin family serine protease
VAPGARIWAVRVEDPDGTISLANELCGLDWIHGHGGIDVANLSFGDTGFDKGNCGLASVPLVDLRAIGLDLSLGRTRLDVIDPEHFAICRVHQGGTTVVVSAGNDTADTTLVTPAAYPEVITVSAYSDLDGQPGGLGPEPCPFEPQEEDDVLATFSNFGRPVDLAAPGVCVTSTVPPLSPGSPATGSYETATGSSFSTPLVAGAAALLKARHPEWSPERVRDELLRSAEPGPIPGDPDQYAEGLLNVRSF